MESPEGPRIVLGIDYGTTQTGLAWMQSDGRQTLSMNDLRLFQKWPQCDAPKVPSLISYTRNPINDKSEQWGFSIAPDSEVIQWNKLELPPRTTGKELRVLRELARALNFVNKPQSNEDAEDYCQIPTHLSKDPGDIAMDYLSKVSEEWYLHMRSQGKYILDEVPLEIVLTHPADWKYEAVNKTFRAVVGAFPEGMFPTLRRISLISEPEACALYTVQDMLRREYDFIRRGECFVLCDAGGGTIDLASYRINSIMPLQITRVGIITGNNFGSTSLDREFLDWLRPKLENPSILPTFSQDGGQFVATKEGQVLLARFNDHKHMFTGTETSSIALVRSAVIATGQEHGIENRVIRITPTETKKIFAKSIKSTMGLINRQVANVESKVFGKEPGKVKNIFLAGGFATNEYFCNAIKESAARDRIRVEIADDPYESQSIPHQWTGVVKGAVLAGMGIGMSIPPPAIPCPRHYGICVSQRHARWRQNYAPRFIDVCTGEELATHQIVWLVRKGDVKLPGECIEVSTAVTFKFSPTDVKRGEDRHLLFVATSRNCPPSSMAELSEDTNEVAQIAVNLVKWWDYQPLLGSTRDGTDHFSLKVKVTLQISERVKVEVQGKSTVLGSYDTNL